VTELDVVEVVLLEEVEVLLEGVPLVVMK